MTSGPVRRGVLAPLALAGALLLACASGAVATAAASPVARPTCTGPASLGCVTCPAPATTCADPTGFVTKGVPVTFDASSSSFSPPATKFSDITWSYATPTSSQSHSGAPQATFTFGDDGTVAVRLEVVDDTGGTGSAVMNVVVGARLLATPSPGIVLGAGTLSDGAQVVGRVNPSSSATVDFRLYGPDDALCTGTPAFQQLGVRYPLGNGSVSSGAFTPTLVGTYRWTVAYGNDANNIPDPSTCAGSTFVSAPPPTPPAPPVGPSSPTPSAGSTPIKGVTTCAGRLATIVAVAGKRTITGTPGPDVIVGGPGDDKIDGRGGNDTICGGPGDDEIRGGAGNDRLYGNDGADLVLGGAGNDYVHGGNGRDRLAGQDGNDHVLGAAGNDLIDDEKLGGRGSDELDGGSGADNIRAADHTTDTIDCGTGRDTVRMDPRDHETLCESVRREH